jgi:hypothetical protein
MKMSRRAVWYTGTNVSVKPADNILYSVLLIPIGLLMTPIPSSLLYLRSAYSSSLRMGATGSSETFTAPYQTRRHIPEDSNLQDTLGVILSRVGAP